MAKEPDARRRNQRSREAILQAAYQLCVDVGYAETTMGAIAERAGVGKQTIYRWWPSKGAVLLEAVNDAVGAHSDFPDTGDVAADLRAQMTALGVLLSTDYGRVYAALIAAAQSDPELAENLWTLLHAERYAACRARLEAGRAAGQINPEADTAAMVELLYGAIHFRLLLRSGPLTPEYIAVTVNALLPG